MLENQFLVPLRVCVNFHQTSGILGLKALKTLKTLKNLQTHIYIQEMFGHRPPRSTSAAADRLLAEAAGGIRPPKGSPGLLRSRRTPSMTQDTVARRNKQ